MARIIHPKDVEHLGQEDSSLLQPSDRTFSIDDLINSRSYITRDIPHAMQIFATMEEYVLTLPQLVAVKANVGKSDAHWKYPYISRSEVYWFSAFYRDADVLNPDDPILMVLHGGGLLTTERMYKEKDHIQNTGLAHVTNEEVTSLSRGQLPTGETFPVYSVEGIRRIDLTTSADRYAVFMTRQELDGSRKQKLTRKEFAQNPFVIALAGGTKHLGNYFDAANVKGKIGAWVIAPGQVGSCPGAYLELARKHGFARWTTFADASKQYIRTLDKSKVPPPLL